MTTVPKIDDKLGGKLKEVIAAFKQKMGYGVKS
jgi:F-type H+-transporting ATPase subunit alpha